MICHWRTERRKKSSVLNRWWFDPGQDAQSRGYNFLLWLGIQQPLWGYCVNCHTKFIGRTTTEFSIGDTIRPYPSKVWWIWTSRHTPLQTANQLYFVRSSMYSTYLDQCGLYESWTWAIYGMALLIYVCLEMMSATNLHGIGCIFIRKCTFIATKVITWMYRRVKRAGVPALVGNYTHYSSLVPIRGCGCRPFWPE